MSNQYYFSLWMPTVVSGGDCGGDGVRLLVWGGESSSVGEGQEGDVSSHALSWKLMDTNSPCITVVLDLHNADSLFALMNCELSIW